MVKTLKINIKHFTNSKIYRILSIFIIIAIICGLKLNNSIENRSAKADTKSEPSFQINNLTFNPQETIVGEDINVSGIIHPIDFEREAPEKRIILVLDISSSMDENGHDRLTPLKDSAKNFLNKVKDIPNLKIAVVAFSTDAFINPKRLKDDGLKIPKYDSDGKQTNKNKTESNSPDYECYEKRFYSMSEMETNNKTSLENMIDSLEAIGGTSTGEGLRKAEYMFEQHADDNNAEKTIILMTDGAPSYYSGKEKEDNNKFYTQIDKNTIRDNSKAPYLGGSGSTKNENVLNNATEYATQIGSEIKNNNVNVYSIGFELDDNGITRLKKIHKSMTGTMVDNNDVNIDKEKEMGFFRAGDLNSIEYVFSDIAENILNKYELDNVQFNLDMDENFTLKIGGNTVNLSNIVYTKKMVSQTKILYTAEDVPFSFTIKANKAGYFNDVFKESNITVPWNNITINVQIPKKEINILSNGVPNIKANLKSITEGPYTTEKYIDLTYTVTPENFRLDSTSSNTNPKDVIIIIDVSKEMGTDYLSSLKTVLFNKLFSDNELMTCKSRYSIITYSNQAEYIKLPSDENTIKKCDTESNYANLLRDEIVNKISLSNDNSNNIEKAFEKALDIINNGRDEKATSQIDVNRDNASASKNIIIIGAGSVNSINGNKFGDQINEIRENNCNVITLNLGHVQNAGGNFTVDNNIEEMQYMLMGKTFDENNKDSLAVKEENNYYVNIDYNAVDNTSNYNQTYNMENSIFPRIVQKLKGQFIKSYPFKINLMFNKGKFNVDLGSGIRDYQGSNNYDLITNDYTIVYERSSSGEYVANPIDISFRIKPNETGELYFGNPGAISYVNLSKENVSKRIEPVKIIVNSKLNILKYGLYEDKSDSDININESNNSNFDIAKGSNVQIGALLYGSLFDGEEIIIESDLEPKNLKISSSELQFNGNMEYFRTETDSENGKIKNIYKYVGNPINDKHILIRYSEFISKNSTINGYINKLEISPAEYRELKLNVVDEPDLF